MSIKFDEQLQKLMNELYKKGEEIQKKADKIVEDFANKNFIPQIQNTSPASSDNTEDKYRDGWYVRRKKTNGRMVYYVSNKNRPELTRILEYGFEKRLKNGGILVVNPRPHIRTTVITTEPILVEKLKNELMK